MPFDPVENIDNALQTWYDTLSKLIDLLGRNPLSFSGIGSNAQSALNNVTKPVGAALIVLCFYIGIFGASASMVEAKRPEAIVRLLFRTAVTGTLVSRGYSFVARIFSITQSLISDFNTRYPIAGALGAEADKVPDDIKKAIAALGFIDKIPITVIGLLASIAITVCSFIVLLTVYGRAYKIIMYMVISPIPLATFAAKSTQQIGIQFLRNFCAAGLEGIIMVLAVWIYTYMQSNVLTSPISAYDPTATAGTMVWNFLQVTIFNILILITIIKTANALAKEMFGV